MWDVAIVGAGPVGLAAAIQAKRHGLRAVVIEAGTLAHTIFRFPLGMTFFSDAPNIEIGGHPLVSHAAKPTRHEALSYYRKVAHTEALDVRTYCAVTAITPLPASPPALPAGFSLAISSTLPTRTTTPAALPTTAAGVDAIDATAIDARFVVVATGYLDRPQRLNVAGENLPHVAHRYVESAPFWGRRVAIVGGSNSAVETALDLYRNGVRVTLIHRGPEVRNSVKYWLKPDFDNRVKEGAIAAIFGATVREITPPAVMLDVADMAGGSAVQAVPADFVMVLIGFRAADECVRALGVDYHGDRPVLSAAYETSCPGLFVIGSAGFGADTRSVFIENGRAHAQLALAEIAQRLGKTLHRH